LKQTLAEIGLPSRPPSPGDSDGIGGWQIGLLAVGAAIALGIIVGIDRRRRAPAPA
jgi:hypothetical protein